MYNPNRSAVVPTPTEVFEIETIFPESPSYTTFSIISLFTAGGSMRTCGGFVFVYPNPLFVTVIFVIIPLVTEHVAMAIVFPTPGEAIEICGLFV